MKKLYIVCLFFIVNNQNILMYAKAATKTSASKGNSSQSYFVKPQVTKTQAALKAIKSQGARFKENAVKKASQLKTSIKSRMNNTKVNQSLQTRKSEGLQLVKGKQSSFQAPVQKVSGIGGGFSLSSFSKKTTALQHKVVGSSKIFANGLVNAKNPEGIKKVVTEVASTSIKNPKVMQGLKKDPAFKDFQTQVAAKIGKPTRLDNAMFTIRTLSDFFTQASSRKVVKKTSKATTNTIGAIPLGIKKQSVRYKAYNQQKKTIAAIKLDKVIKNSQSTPKQIKFAEKQYEVASKKVDANYRAYTVRDAVTNISNFITANKAKLLTKLKSNNNLMSFKKVATNRLELFKNNKKNIPKKKTVKEVVEDRLREKERRQEQLSWNEN